MNVNSPKYSFLVIFNAQKYKCIHCTNITDLWNTSYSKVKKSLHVYLELILYNVQGWNLEKKDFL